MTQEPNAEPDQQTKLFGGADDFDTTDNLYQAADDFEHLGLNAALLSDLYMAEFDKPSQIQLRAIPAILKNPPRSLIAQSPNGTGKTLAYILGVLQRIDINNDQLQAVCLLPTRELVIQTYKEYVAKLTQSYNIKTSVLIRNPPVDFPPEKAQLILSTTGQFDKKCNDLQINTVRILAIDEADHVLSQQTFSQFFNSFFPKLTANKAQILLFSATLSDQLFKFVNEHISENQLTKITREKGKVFQPTNHHYFKKCVDENDKIQTLSTIFQHFNANNVFIFVNRKDYAKQLHQIITENGYDAQFYSSELNRTQRDHILQQFRDTIVHVIICTDVLSRGVDIPAAKLVINFDMPLGTNLQEDLATYTHRQGRTGRWGRRGVVINFILNNFEHDEKLFNLMSTQNIELLPYDEQKIKEELA